MEKQGHCTYLVQMQMGIWQPETIKEEKHALADAGVNI